MNVNSYRYIQAFSIDVTIGSVIGAFFVSRYLGVVPGAFLLIELALVVWLIYTFDHLIDSGSGLYDIVSFRHKVHKKFATTIWGIWSIVLVVAFSMLFKIPPNVRIAGGILSFIVFLYFLSLKLLEGKDIYHKEISCSLIYTTGVFLGPICIYGMKVNTDVWILYLEFIWLAMINLLIFSMFEKVSDEKSGFKSLVKAIGIQKVRIITILLICFVLILSISSMFIYETTAQIFKAQLLVFVMGSTFALILMWKKTLILKERYRIIGDAVFFLPVIYLFI